jgi:hypothetical protein
MRSDRETKGDRSSSGSPFYFVYSFSKNSQPEQEMKIPPGVLRSRSFTRFTILVGLPHFGQSVLLVVSMIFLRSAVLAILAMIQSSPEMSGAPRP